MGTKENPGAFDCLAKADEDEPFFVLLARDPTAPDIVEMWAFRRRLRLTVEDREPADEKNREALSCAAAMRAWQKGRTDMKAAGRHDGCPAKFSSDFFPSAYCSLARGHEDDHHCERQGMSWTRGMLR